ncbi:hypothetical protein CRYUN_Cryun07bG0062800 [Craigia yunnanensis]
MEESRSKGIRVSECNGFFFAVKEVSLLDQGNQGKQSIIQLEHEIALLSQFEHENIVPYYGTDKSVSFPKKSALKYRSLISDGLYMVLSSGSSIPVERQVSIEGRDNKAKVVQKQDSTSRNCSDLENWEYDIVQVMEETDWHIKVLFLERVDGLNSVFKAQVKEGSNATVEIPQVEQVLSSDSLFLVNQREKWQPKRLLGT